MVGQFEKKNVFEYFNIPLTINLHSLLQKSWASDPRSIELIRKTSEINWNRAYFIPNL